jgi:arsenate reductase
MYILYGIPNCDTVKKARTWLEKHKIAYQFHDYKQHGINAAKLKAWMKAAGWDTVLNKKSTTWRALTAEQQADIMDAASAIPFLQENTSGIKRPLIEKEGKVVVIGFDEKKYADLFK